MIENLNQCWEPKFLKNNNSTIQRWDQVVNETLFSLKKGLDGHKRACHTDESNLKVCHICGYKAATNQTMRMHIEAKHEKKRDFACNVCEAKFYRKFKLDLHVRGKLQCFRYKFGFENLFWGSLKA